MLPKSQRLNRHHCYRNLLIDDEEATEGCAVWSQHLISDSWTLNLFQRVTSRWSLNSMTLESNFTHTTGKLEGHMFQLLHLLNVLISLRPYCIVTCEKLFSEGHDARVTVAAGLAA